MSEFILLRIAKTVVDVLDQMYLIFYTKLKNKNNIFLFLGIFQPLVISLIAFRRVLLSPGIIQHGDLGFPLDMWNYIPYNLQLWNNWVGGPTIHLPKILIVIPICSLLLLNVSSEIVMKLFPFFAFVFAGTSMYISVALLSNKSYTLKKQFACSIASLFFMLNLWVAQELIHHFWIIWAYGALPLCLSLYRRILKTKKRKIKDYFFLSVFLGVLCTQPQFIVYGIVLIIAMFIFHLVYAFYEWGVLKSTNVSIIKRYVVNSILLVMFFLLVNAYFLFPIGLQMITGRTSPAYTITIEDIARARASLFNTLILDNWPWQREISFSFDGPVLNFISLLTALLIPFLAFLSSILNSKDKDVQFFSIVALLSILLAMGTQGPLGDSFYTLVKFPFGWVLRIPQRLNSLIIMSYSFLMALLICKEKPKIHIQIEFLDTKMVKINFNKLLSILILFSILFRASPLLLTGNFDSQLVSMEPPPEYKWAVNQTRSLLSDSDSKVLWSSFDLKYSWDPTGYSGKNIGALSSYNPVFGYELYNQRFIWYLYYRQFRSNDYFNEKPTDFLGKFLQLINIKYTVIHTDLLSRYKEIWEKVIEVISKQSDMKLVAKNDPFYIYESDVNCSQFFIPIDNYLYTGDYGILNTLISIPKFTPIKHGLISLCEDFNFRTEKLNTVRGIISGKKDFLNDLIFLFAESKYIINPFTYVEHNKPAEMWSRFVLSYNTYYSFLLANHIDNWESDYKRGVIATTANNTQISIPIKVEEKDNYHLYIRCLNNHIGGTIQISIDNVMISIVNTTSSRDQFVWVKLGNVTLARGAHTLSLRNIKGLNMINVFAMIPGDKIKMYETEAYELATQIENIFILEKIPLNSTIYLNTLKSGNYQIGIKNPSNFYAGKISLQIGEKILELTKDNLNGTLNIFSDLIWLNKGKNKIDVLYSKGENWDTISNCKTIKNWSSINGQIYATTDSNQGDLSIESMGATGLIYDLPLAIDFTQYDILNIILKESYPENVEISLCDSQGRESSSIEFLTSTTWSIENFNLTAFRSNEQFDLSNVKKIKFSAIYPDFNIMIDEVSLSKGKIISRIPLLVISSNKISNITLFDSSEMMPQLTYELISPSKYVVKINTQQTFTLCFAEVYDPLWSAKVGGKRYEPIKIFSLINGFWINQTGELEITIEYEPQKWFYYGSTISVTSLIISLIIFARAHRCGRI